MSATEASAPSSLEVQPTQVKVEPISHMSHSSENHHLVDFNSVENEIVHCVRMLLTDKEVGGIIGKQGSLVKKIREESGAKINITDSSCPERVVTVAGNIQQVEKAFDLICAKWENDFHYHSQTETSTDQHSPVAIKLLFPTFQCGYIIGKGGCKVKELRMRTGASIQVASQPLPQCAEKVVCVSGTGVAVSKCIRNLCELLAECPHKGPVLQYKPRASASFIAAPTSGPQHQFPYVSSASSVPVPTSSDVRYPLQMAGSVTTPSPCQGTYPLSVQSPVLNSSTLLLPPNLASLQNPAAAALYFTGGAVGNPSPLATFLPTVAGLALVPPPTSTSFLSPAMPWSAAATPIFTQQQQTFELCLPNDLVGCIIGRGGCKINDIRETSGAQIKIDNMDKGGKERRITISGSTEQVQRAHLLIQQSIEAFRQMLVSSLLTPSPVKGGSQFTTPPPPPQNKAPPPLPPLPGTSTGGGLQQQLGRLGAPAEMLLQPAGGLLPMWSPQVGSMPVPQFGGSAAAMGSLMSPLQMASYYTGSPAATLMATSPAGPFSPLLPSGMTQWEEQQFKQLQQSVLITKLRPSVAASVVPKYNPY